MATKRNIYFLLALAVFQVLSSTYFLRVEGLAAVNSILFLLSGVTMSFLLTMIPEITLSSPAKKFNGRFVPWVKIGLIIVLLPVGYHYSRQIMDATPIAIENADMLPIINVMGQRFLQGNINAVYAPIPEIWNGIQPIYPPVLWMSFLPAQLFHFDLRWMTVLGIYACAMICFFLLPFQYRSKWIGSLCLATALAVLLFWLHADDQNNVIRLTEEGVVFFYYCLMACAIASRNAWLIGLAAALCLLSRFAIVGWLPCLALYWLLKKEYVSFGKAFLAGTVAILLLLIIPFGWKPVQLFLSLPEKYIAHAQNVWDTFPDHFTKSLGMAKFFGKENVELLHQCLLLTSFLVPLLFMLYFLFQKERKSANLLLASFQLALTMFYNFLDVSYLYLYYTPVFVSLLIAVLALNSQRSEAKRLISST